MLGRYFSKQDDSPGAPDTAIVTYGYWQRKFGGDPGIRRQRRFWWTENRRQIIGVLPQTFSLPRFAGSRRVIISRSNSIAPKLIAREISATKVLRG